MNTQCNSNIFLIGPMGAGKSSVGRYLASQLKIDFYDSDEEIEKRAGADMGWILDIEGHAGLCKREIAIITELVQHPRLVLATGGGSVESEEVQLLLKHNGIVVFLDASLGSQQARTTNEARRPLLRVPNRDEVIQNLYVERSPIYKKLADFTIKTDKKSVSCVGQEIIRMLR